MNPLSGSCIPQLDAPLVVGAVGALCEHKMEVRSVAAAARAAGVPHQCRTPWAGQLSAAAPSQVLREKNPSLSADWDLGFFVTSRWGALVPASDLRCLGDARQCQAVPAKLPGAMDGAPQVMMQPGQGMRTAIAKPWLPKSCSFGSAGPCRPTLPWDMDRLESRCKTPGIT